LEASLHRHRLTTSNACVSVCWSCSPVLAVPLDSPPSRVGSIGVPSALATATKTERLQPHPHARTPREIEFDEKLERRISGEMSEWTQHHRRLRRTAEDRQRHSR
jgi:hypothetical protein